MTAISMKLPDLVDALVSKTAAELGLDCNVRPELPTNKMASCLH
jgi:hypothetical protein